jgi:hypothetical protein
MVAPLSLSYASDSYNGGSAAVFPGNPSRKTF